MVSDSAVFRGSVYPLHLPGLWAIYKRVGPSPPRVDAGAAGAMMQGGFRASSEKRRDVM